MTGVPGKRISGTAYQALRNALSYSFWYKSTLEKYLRDALRENLEILRDIDFNQKKRIVADDLVDRLREREDVYQPATIQLMIELAHMERFPEIESLEDADKWLPKAKNASADLMIHISVYENLISERVKHAAELSAIKTQNDLQRRFSDELSELREEFIQMHSMEDARRRGYAFEGFLNSLFALFDLDPRLNYELKTEQIDGAFSFDTDDYIVEAKWTKNRLSREKADAFDAKVKRRGKNALGLIISINGLSADAIEEYRRRTSFMTVDGADIMWVLDGHIALDELLRRKKRHANETGECHFPVTRIYKN
ncbi:restriction endonuclease [Streptosporangium sp. NPDC001681]|uniref:restriction endonuclease n=1 Tax=Streptosporangium sp. NPDC001681 TaxID=3154395 RepID=UPI00331F274B